MEKLEEKLFYICSLLPFPEGAILPFIITFIVGVTVYLLSRDIDPECTSKKQALLEVIYETLEKLVISAVGEQHCKTVMPVLSTIFLYVLCSNLLGLVPGLKSPTSIFSNCLGTALITSFYVFYFGFKAHSFGFIKNYTGTVWWMAPIMFPIHLISEISHPVSLTLRLFGNIMGEDAVILVLTGVLCPLLLPIPMMLMSIFTSVLQAVVFTTLSGIYLSSALNDPH